MTIELKGRIDSNNASQVEKNILDRLDGKRGEPVVLDASALEYISSAGLRVLLSAHKIMSRQGKMRLINVNEVVQEVFDVTGAGDTVVAVFSLALVAGFTPLEAAFIGNLAAGIVVRYFGCATTTIDQLEDTIDKIKPCPKFFCCFSRAFTSVFKSRIWS